MCAAKADVGTGGIQRIPFWSSKQPEITTTLGKSKYHLSGYHSQRVSGNEFVMDNLSLLGQRLDGPDLGPVTITLKQPVRAPVTRAGGFKTKATFILTSGAESTALNGEISGKLERGGASLASMCMVMAADKGSLTFGGNAKIASSITVGLA